MSLDGELLGVIATGMLLADVVVQGRIAEPDRLLVPPAPLAAKFEMAKQAEDLLTGSLDQRLIYEACRRGVLQRQLPILRAHYQHKRDVMERAVRAGEVEGCVGKGQRRPVSLDEPCVRQAALSRVREQLCRESRATRTLEIRKLFDLHRGIDFAQ